MPGHGYGDYVPGGCSAGAGAKLTGFDQPTSADAERADNAATSRISGQTF